MTPLEQPYALDQSWRSFGDVVDSEVDFVPDSLDGFELLVHTLERKPSLAELGVEPFEPTPFDKHQERYCQHE